MPNTLPRVSKELERGEERGASHIIHIAKPTGLGLLRMMQPARPINRDIRNTLINPLRRANTPARGNRTKLENTFKRRTIFTCEAARAAAGQFFRRLGHDAFEEVDVFVCVEAGELGFGGADGTLRADEDGMVRVVRNQPREWAKGERARNRKTTDEGGRKTISKTTHDASPIKSVRT